MKRTPAHAGLPSNFRTTAVPSLAAGALTLLAGVLTALIVTQSTASAADLYWDSNGNTAGFGNTTGTWGTSAFWNDNSTGGAPTGAFTATTSSSDIVNFGTATLNYANGTIGVLAGGVAADSIVIGGGQTTSISALGTSGNAITIHSGGITKNSGSAAVSFTSGITLAANQTWTNNTAAGSAGLLEVAENEISSNVNFVTNGGFQLTIDGTGNTTIGRSNNTAHRSLSGSGALVKNGTGVLQLGGDNATAGGGASPFFSGKVTINGGVVNYGDSSGSLGTGNIEINGGILEARWGSSITRNLGEGAGQIQITGGVSGLSGANGTSMKFNNDINYEVVWGSPYFKPSEFVVGSANTTVSISLDNKYDLNGANRTLRISSAVNGSASFTQIIRNSSVTPAGLIKTGPARINLNAANTYNGGTTLEDGTLQLGNASGLGSNSGSLTVNGGLLNLNNMAAVTVGNLTGSGGTIANNGNAAITFTIGNGGGTGGNFQGVIANNNNAGTGTLALVKTGAGTITLSGTNTYTGTTLISGGTLQIGNGGTTGSLATSALTNNATLIYDRSNDFSVGHTISGIGQLIKQGAGTMTLTLQAAYSGNHGCPVE